MLHMCYLSCLHFFFDCVKLNKNNKQTTKCVHINLRDVKRKNIVTNVDMSSLRAPWQNGSYKNQHTEKHEEHEKHEDATDFFKNYFLFGFFFFYLFIIS